MTGLWPVGRDDFQKVFLFFLACPLYSASDPYRMVRMIFFALRRCLDPPPTMAKFDQNHISALTVYKLVKTLCRLH